MRAYEFDSDEAVARVFSMTMLVDGWLDRSEIEALRANGFIERFGITPEIFDSVLEAFCDDLMAQESSDPRLRPAPADVERVLDEIRSPEKRSALLDAMMEIISADGRMTADEASLVSLAMKKWGGELTLPSHSA